jgi:hypothetical protein
LTLSNLTPAASGNYSVVATATGGSATSTVATLTVILLSSSVTLTSPTNPAGYLDNLSFTAAVTPTNATGSIQFFTNGAAFDTQPLAAGSAVSTNLSSLPRGTNIIVAAYSGDANDLPSTNTLLQIITNHPPTAPTVYYSRAPGSPLTIAVTNLAATWSDVDGDTISLAGVSVSTNGVTIANNGVTLGYFDSNDVPDQFTCMITDGFGGTNFQTVNIVVRPSGGSTPDIVSVAANPDGSFTLLLAGAPGDIHILEATPSLALPATWQPLATNTLDATGVWQFTDAQATNFLRQFYRIQLAQ